MNINNNKIPIKACVIKEEFATPPKTEGITFSISPGRKGQKIGVISWVKRSRKTWDMFPKRTEKTRVDDNLHLPSTLFLLILNKKFTKAG